MENETTQKPIIEKILFAAFLCLIFSLAFMKPSVFDLAGQPISATDVLFPIVVVLFLLSLMLRQRKLHWHRAYFFLGAYAAAFLLASAFSADPQRSFIKTASTIYLVGLAVLAFNIVDDEHKLRFTILAWLAVCAFPVLIGIFTIILFYASPSHSLLSHLTYHYGAVPVGNYPRLSSTFVSASMFCNYLNVSLLLLLIAHIREWIGDHMFWIYFVLLSICALFTISSGLGGIALGLSIWYLYTNRHQSPPLQKIISASGVLIASLFLLSSFVALQPHPTATFSFHVPIVGTEVFPSSRLMVWMESFNTFRSNFFTGNGPGFPSAGVMYQNTDGSYSFLTDAHNVFLSVAAQTGIVGLIAVLALCVFVLRIGLRRKEFLDNKAITFGLPLAFATAFVFQGLTGAFEDARHLWVLMGLITAADKMSPKNETAEMAEPD